MRRLIATLTFAALPLLAAAQPASIGWPEAVARLAGERTRAVTCAARARALALGPQRATGLEAAYGAAKAEMDGVIAGLIVALAQSSSPTALPDLERRLILAFQARERFCTEVIARMPPPRAGERNVLVQTVGAAIGELIEAVVEIYKRGDDNDRMRRDTIRAQMEATRWPEFSAIPPAR